MAQAHTSAGKHYCLGGYTPRKAHFQPVEGKKVFPRVMSHCKEDS